MTHLKRRIASVLLVACLLIGLLPTSALAVETKAAGAFEVTGESNSYSYADGVLTVNDGANITISMASGATTPTSDRIVVAANATATITLNGVSITGPGPDISSGAPAQSAIDVGENAHLILNLKDETSNVLIGGSGGTDLGAPGIHVPSPASLVVQGSGGLSVTGGNSTATHGGSGIGGKPGSSQAGEACGTVIILATGDVTVTGGDGLGTTSDGLDIGGGLGTTDGDNGQGIRPVSGQENTYTVWGDLKLPCAITIPEGATVVIPEGASLTVPEDVTLTNSGTILVQGGTFTNNGTVSGNQPAYPSKVTVSFSQDGQTVTSVPYGSTVTITATMEKAETATNALEVDPGMVGFYLGEDIQYGILVGTDDVEIVDGVYTAAVEVTLDDEKGVTEVRTITITADFGGYAPEGDESGDSLAPNTGSAELTVVESYSIDYEEETITIADGFSLYEAETGGNAIFTSNGENNTISLTEYIQSTNKTLYLQAPSAGEGEQPDRREITIPARPQAPSNTPTISYSEEKLNFPPAVTETTLEYALSQSDPNWQDVPSGAALSEMGWTGTAIYLYFRTGATDSAFASETTQSPLTIPARPEAPNDLLLMDWTDVSVTYYVGAGVQCRLGNEGAWVTLGQNETDYTFTDLTPQTTYTIYARKPATESQFASAEASDEVTTKSSAAEPPAMTYEVTANSITLSYSAPWQYQTSDDEWISVEGSKEFTSLEAATEYTFTVRVAESETAEASKVGTVKVYTAHATPTVGEGYSINYGAETISVNSGYEVNTAKDFTGTVIQGDTSLSDYTGQTLYIRHKADEGGAPASAAVAISIPARPAAPAVQGSNESVQGQNDGKITGLTAGTDYEISTDSGKNWKDAELTGTEIVDLAPGTYQVRVKSTSSSFAGAVAKVTIATGAERTYTLNVTAPAFDRVYTGYNQPEAKTITISSSGNSDATISSVSVNGTDFTISGSGSTVPAGGSITTWTIQPAAGLGAGPHTATITVAYNEGATATAEVSFTVSRRSSGGSSSSHRDEGPSTGDSDGWRDIQDEVADAEDGDTITIDMGDETEVPSEIFEEVAGKDVDVEIDLGGGVSWTVNGQDVPEGVSLSDLDLGVSMDTKGIPANVFNAVTGEYGSVQFTLAHDGAFGFALTLTAPLGRENAGYWANLYYYNERGQELEFITSARIGRDGSAALRLEHASQYAVVIDDVSHEPVNLPFTDVPEGYWAYYAIQYVYGEGLMAGTSGSTFNPEGTTTRGQIVTILWRLSDSPVVNYLMDFSDVDPTAYYGEAIRWATSEGIVGGYGGGLFGPDDMITREQLAVMLYRYAQHEGYDTTQGGMAIREYADYEQISDFALEALDWAVSAGIINGTSATTLSPSGSATRAQVAVILMRFCQDIANT